jgi:predicted Zn-dependent peptidase
MNAIRSLRAGVVAALAVALLSPARPSAQPAPPADAAVARATDPRIPFEKYTLGNGLEVILAPDPTVPLVAVNVWYHVGSGLEDQGKSGFAHLFEHMLFQGSKHVGEDRHFEILKKIGGDGVNGTTNLDRTNYFEIVPSNQLEAGLWLESDRMGHLLPLLTQKSLSNQIEVVRNERRQRYDNVPYGAALLARFDALYPAGHPYKYLTIGRHEDLAGATLADVVAFWKTWYVPANATLTLVGDFEPATARALVQKWFAGFPRSARPPVVAVPPPTPRAERRVLDDKLAKLRQVTWAFHSPANFAEGDAELDILADALARDGTGRLYRALVYSRPLAQSVSASQGGAGFSGSFTITVTLRSGADLAEVERILTDELGKVRRAPLDGKELARTVVSVEASRIYGLESLMGRANLLQSYNHYLGDPDRISWDLDRYRRATPQSVQEVAARVLDLDRKVVIVTMPASAPAAAPAASQGGAP